LYVFGKIIKKFFPQKHSANVLEKPVQASSENTLKGAGEVRPPLPAIFRLAFTVLKVVRCKIKFKASKNAVKGNSPYSCAFARFAILFY